MSVINSITHLLKTSSVGGLMLSTLNSAMNRVSTGFLPPPGGPIAPIYRMSFRDCAVDTVSVIFIGIGIGIGIGIYQ